MPKNQEFSNLSNLKNFCTYLLIKWILSIDKVNIQHLNLNAFFPRMVVLKKYPKISGYLDRISKIWIMKKFDIQSIQVSMYPKKIDIHVSNYPCIQVSMISKYPIIQVSKKNQYPRYPSIRISEKSGIHSSLGVKRWFMSRKFDAPPSIWIRPQGSQGCQKIRIFFHK